MKSITVTDIQKTATGIILFTNGSYIATSITEAQDVSNTPEGIVVSPTGKREDRFIFNTEGVKSVGVNTYTPQDQNSALAKSQTQERKRLIFNDLVKDLLSSCCSTLNILTTSEEIRPTSISLISTDMVGFFAFGKLLFGCSVKSLVQSEKNRLIIGNVRIALDQVDTVLTTSYTPLQENTGERNSIERRFNTILTQLLTNVFKSSCETATAGSTVNIDLRVLDITTSNPRHEDWAPAGWPNASDLVKVIRINSTATQGITMISGLSNGAPGRIVTLSNVSADNLLILEKTNPLSLSANQFDFDGRGAYFLFPGKTITLLHDGVRWNQFSGSPSNGLLIFDDFHSSPYGSQTSQQPMTGFALGAGAGALTRNENIIMPGGMGNLGLQTGSTATGAASLRTSARSTESQFYFSAAVYRHTMMVSRLNFNLLPVTGQDYQFIFGLNISALITNQTITGFNGWLMQNNGTLRTYASNNTSSIISSVLSSLTAPLAPNNRMVMGIYCPTNVGDFVFFYSLDDKTYVVERRFTRTTGSFGGSPHIGIQKLSGTTAVAVVMDYLGFYNNTNV
jgi:hypothetical protein